MGINKLVYFGETKFDLSSDTAEAENVEKGYTFHNKAGNLVTGTLVKPSGTKTITSNGTYDVKSVESAVVNVPIPEGYVKPSGTTTLTSNGSTYLVKDYEYAKVSVPTQTKTVTPDTLTQEVKPDDGKLLSGVTVAAIPSTYVKPSGTLSVDITSPTTSTYSVKNYEYVEFNPKVQTRNANITSNGTYSVVRRSGYVGMDTVNITVDVPTSGGDYKSSVLSFDIAPFVNTGYDCLICAYLNNSGHPEYKCGYGVDFNESIYGDGYGHITLPVLYDEDSGHCFPVVIIGVSGSYKEIVTINNWTVSSQVYAEREAPNTITVYPTTNDINGTITFDCGLYQVNN